MDIGKKKRLNRIFGHESGNAIIVPMDHGITMGPINGINNINETINTLSLLPINAVVLHKGIIKLCEKELIDNNLPIIMHLSANTNLGVGEDYKVKVASVAEAVQYGCDAVSYQVNFRSNREEQMLMEFAKVSEECYKYGMPLFAMMYAKGKEVKNENDIDVLCHIARVAAELGADFVKINYNGDSEGFKKVISSCMIPVLIAGGEKLISEDSFLEFLINAMESGIRGVAIGRNIFQSQDISCFIRNIETIVHGRMKIERN